MSAERVGSVKSGKSRKSYYVFWNRISGEVYVGWAGKTRVPGKASTASQAADMCEVFLRNK